MTAPWASSTVMRSLEWATSDRKRASLWRRCKSSASEAPSTASDTCEASETRESTSSGGNVVGEDRTRTPRPSSRAESGRRSTGPRSRSLSSPRMSSGRLVRASCSVPLAESRSHAPVTFDNSHSSAHSEAAAKTAPSSRLSTRRTATPSPASARTAEMDASLTCSPPPAATSSTPAVRSASSRAVVRSS